MDSIKFLLYTLARIGLMLLLAVFSAFVGEIIFPAIVSLVPSSATDLKNFMTDPVVDSVIGMIIITFFLVWIFYDDGKRHSAYESWSSVNITIVFLLMIFIYFIPAIFRDSFAAEGKLDVFYLVLYYPCRWLTEKFEMNYLISVIVGMGIILVASFMSYFTAFKLYVKKHPFILQQMNERKYASENEEDNESDEDKDVIDE